MRTPAAGERAGWLAAGGAVRPGPGRTAGPSAATIGPRRQVPPLPIGRRAAPLLRHLPTGGAPSWTRGKVRRNLRVHGGGGEGGAARGGGGAGLLETRAAATKGFPGGGGCLVPAFRTVAGLRVRALA